MQVGGSSFSLELLQIQFFVKVAEMAAARTTQQLQEQMAKAEMKMRASASSGLQMVPEQMIASGLPKEIAELKLEQWEFDEVDLADGTFGHNDPGHRARRLHFLSQMQKMEPKFRQIQEMHDEDVDKISQNIF